MTGVRLPIAIALIAGLATPAWSQTESVSAHPDHTALVIYRFHPIDTSSTLERGLEDASYGSQRGLAMIVETRTVDVPAGEGMIRFEDLATGILPETAVLDGLPGEVLERNTDFDVLSPGSLLQHSIGETVQVVRINRQTGEEATVPAMVRSGAQGPLLEIDGRLEALSCQGLTQRLIFDRVPAGLGDKPVLSVRTRSPVAGRYTIRLAYLASGLNWSADYVARLEPDGTAMDIEGWITLMNFGGGGFADASVQVVAGNLNYEGDAEALEPDRSPIQSRCWPMDTTTSNGMAMTEVRRELTRGRGMVVDYLATVPDLSNSVIEEVVVTGSRIQPALAQLGDYKIYTLPETTDLNAAQAKQIRFFDQRGVRFSRTYQVLIDHDDDSEPPSAHLMLRLRNDARDGLGVPMPGGGISLVEQQDGVTILTGQAQFMDRGEGVPLALEFGQAMGLSVDFKVVDQDQWRVGEVAMRKASIEAVLANDKDWPVEMEVVPAWSGWPGFRVLSESRRSVVNETGDTVWRVRVPAHRSESLNYTIQTED